MTKNPAELSSLGERIVLIGLSLTLPTSIAGTNLFLAVGLVLVIVKVIRGGGVSLLPWRGSGLLLMMTIGWELIAMTLNDYPMQFRAYAEDRWVLVAGLVAYQLVPDARFAFQSLTWSVGAGCGVAIIALVEHWLGFDPFTGRMMEFEGGRYVATGCFNHHLTYGGSAMILALGALSFFSGKMFDSGVSTRANGKRLLRWFIYGLPVIITTLGLLFSMARSALLGFLAGTGVWLIVLARRFRLIVMATTFLFFIGAILLVPGSLLRFTSLWGGMSPNELTRVGLWKSAYQIISEHPWVGVGYGNWREALYQLGSSGYYVSTAHPHNDWLTIAVRSGLPGLALFALFWLSLMRRFYHTIAKGDARIGDDSQSKEHRRHQRSIVVWGLTTLVGMTIGGLFQNYQTDAEVAGLMWWVIGLSMRSLCTDD